MKEGAAVKVGLVGYDLVGKRVADAVAAQSDMVLHAVHETDPRRRQAAASKGYAVAADLGRLAKSCDIVVNCSAEWLDLGAPMVHRLKAQRGPCPAFSILSSPAEVHGLPAMQIPSANAILFTRLLHALAPLGPVERFFASTFLRAGHAVEPRTGCVDALEPVFDDPVHAWDLERVLGPKVRDVYVRQVRGPYTHSHLHMIKIDLLTPPAAADATALMRQGPRLLTAAARDGFADTARVQEFYRDMDGSRPDRFEVFVWEESIAIDGGSLLLMADVDPDAAPVPEIIDAVRLNQRPGLSMAESVAQTDAALGVRRRWQDFRAGRR